MEGFSDDELTNQIRDFLRDFKELMGEGRYYVKDHFKNLQTLAELGLTEKQRDEIILAISLVDFVSGPNPDQYRSGYYWVFGKELNGTEIYIKLKLVTFKNGNEKAVCISFHPSEFPMNYPFR
jgi:hypothetical protein